MTIAVGIIVADAAARFAAAGLDSARLDARLLVGHVLGLDASLLFARSALAVTPEQQSIIENFVQRRLAHEPVARITGTREFWSLAFNVTPDVLDPRPDTETLVEAALALKKGYGEKPARILDLGTGSGCILLSILSGWPQATGVGVDRSEKAVAVAAENARQLGLESRAQFRVGNWCEGLDGKFDAIVSNPPYITTSDLAALAPGVRNFDPALALDAGPDGLGAYRALLPTARARLNPGGTVLLEIGAGQAPAVSELLKAAGLTVSAEKRDLAGFVRCLVAG